MTRLVKQFSWTPNIGPLIGLLLCGMLYSPAALGQLYSYTDANGVRVFTDQRPSGVRYTTVTPPSSAPATTPRSNSSQLFVYQKPGGERLITNLQHNDRALTLIATIGRPTASVRCGLPASEVMRPGHGPYADIISREALRHGLDPILIKTVIWVESCFDPNAVSRVGAQGLMQLMPGTAAELGVTDAFDPEQNIRGGTEYLARMLRRFDGQLDLALAAYNAGPGAVQRHGGIPPFRETRQYIERINAHYAQHRPAPIAVIE